jgi:membrane protein YqaA with SNARE-associated domain
MPLAGELLAILLVWRWVLRLGGPGLILLGVLDNSIVPLTGSMDVLTIWLAAGHRDAWPYYAFMATVGAVIGGYITYALGRKGGKEAIERKLRKDKAEKLLKRFDRWGFGSVAVGALLPPPFPLVPVLLAAGALQYSRKKFVAALTLGRSVRYCLVAGLGSLYARPITSFFSRYYKPTALVLTGIAAIGSFFAIREYMHSRKHHSDKPGTLSPTKAA